MKKLHMMGYKLVSWLINFFGLLQIYSSEKWENTNKQLRKHKRVCILITTFSQGNDLFLNAIQGLKNPIKNTKIIINIKQSREKHI